MIQVYTGPVARNGHEDAYALLEVAHIDFTGCPAPAVWKTERGKPFFVDGSLEFSLSHSRTLAVCVLSDSGAVGVDAEDIRSVRPRIEDRVLTEAEHQWLRDYPDRDIGFLTLWTRKESLVKLTGQGLDGQPQAVETMPHPPKGVQFHTFCLDKCIVTVCAKSGAAVQLVKQ